MKYSFMKLGLVLLIGSLGFSSSAYAVFGSSAMSMNPISEEDLDSYIAEQDIPAISDLIVNTHNVRAVPFLKKYVKQGHAWACYLLLKRLADSSFSNGDPDAIVLGMGLVIMLEILAKMAESTVKKGRSEDLPLVWDNIFCRKVDQYFYSVSCQGIVVEQILQQNYALYEQALTNVKKVFTSEIRDYCTGLPFAYWVATVNWANSVSQAITWEKPTEAQKALFVDHLYEQATTSQEQTVQKKIITDTRSAVYDTVVAAFQRTIDDLKSK